MLKKNLKKIPAVDYLLEQNEIKELNKNFSDDFIKYSIRNVLNEIRSHSKKGIKVPSVQEIVEQIINFVKNNLTNVSN